MSYGFGATSLKNLATCRTELQTIAYEAIKIVNFTVICGHRGQKEQEEAFAKGNSKLHFPDSKHNPFPSEAMDCVPYPLDWDDIQSFAYMQGIFKGIAQEKGILIRQGCDWNSNGYITDNKYFDWPHVELILVNP